MKIKDRWEGEEELRRSAILVMTHRREFSSRNRLDPCSESPHCAYRVRRCNASRPPYLSFLVLYLLDSGGGESDIAAAYHFHGTSSEWPQSKPGSIRIVSSPTQAGGFPPKYRRQKQDVCSSCVDCFIKTGLISKHCLISQLSTLRLVLNCRKHLLQCLHLYRKHHIIEQNICQVYDYQNCII